METIKNNENFLEAEKNDDTIWCQLDYRLVFVACCILGEDEIMLMQKVVAPVLAKFGALITQLKIKDDDYRVEITISIPPFFAVFDVIDAIKKETYTVMVSYNAEKYKNFFWLVDYFVCAETEATPEILDEYKTMRKIIDPQRVSDGKLNLALMSRRGGD